MNVQKTLSILSVFGLGFMIFLVVAGSYAFKNRGEVIGDKVEVSDKFASHFSRVITKNRETPMTPTRFATPSGEAVSWQDFEGEYLLVNFWATWCAPCVVELPSLDKLEKKFNGKGLKIIAVSLDFQRSHDDVNKFLYSRNIGEFAGYMDVFSEIQKNVTMRGIPTSYLLDPKGNVLHIFEGDARWDAPEAIRFFEKLLNAGK